MKKGNYFKIAHLSDLHLTKTDGSRRTELKIFKPLKGMNAAFRKIINTSAIQNSDLLLVTGDVTDRGDIKSWEVFWTAITDARFLDRVLVIPGNHDVCCLGARMPGKRIAYKKADLQKAINGLKMGNQHTKFPWVVAPDKRLAIFGLNSNNLGNLNIATNAMGNIDYFQLSSLAGQLYKHRHVPVKIIALHHSPNIPKEETARKRAQRPYSKLERIGHQISQDERRALRLLCISHRVRLVAHGHLHMAEDRRVGGIRMIGSPSTTEPISRNKNNIYQFYTYQINYDGSRLKSNLHLVKV